MDTNSRLAGKSMPGVFCACGKGDAAMDISFYCKKCGQHILIEESAAGVLVNCPNCSVQLVVPAQSEQTKAPAVPPKPRQTESQKNRGLAIAASVLAGIIVLSVAGIFALNHRRSTETSKATRTEAAPQPKPLFKKKDSPAVAAARAKLELATQKSDLDSMFLALKELQALGEDSTEIADRLARVQAAIPLLQKVRVHQSDHDHEEVVKAAGALLEYFPEHAEARRALKESGLIFAFLQEAIYALDGCFEKAPEGKPQLISKRENEKHETDYDKVFYNLDKAERAAEEAKKRDPLFPKAIGIQKLVSDTKDTLAIRLCWLMISTSADSADREIKFYDTLYRGLEDSLYSRYSTPQDFWRSVSGNVRRYREAEAEVHKEISKISALLAGYKSGVALEYVQTSRDIALKSAALLSAVTEPMGNMNDYKASVNRIYEDLTGLFQKYKASAPNPNSVVESLVGAATAVSTYQLFRTPDETQPILDKHKTLISA
jgi:DNA-directed RNA polymerase subunit RPC12/RpoP